MCGTPLEAGRAADLELSRAEDIGIVSAQRALENAHPVRDLMDLEGQPETYVAMPQPADLALSDARRR